MVRNPLVAVLFLTLALLLGACQRPQGPAPAPNPAATLTLSTPQIKQNEPLRVSWRAPSATACTLETPPHPPTNVTCAEGSQEVRYSTPGSYTVTLKGARAGSAQTLASAHVEVLAEDPQTPRITLFDGTSGEAWQRTDGKAFNWPLRDGYMEVLPGVTHFENNIQTKEAFGDFKLHLEFWLPAVPADAKKQGRSNSGVYLQGRYEVQILETYGFKPGQKNSGGAIYGVADPSKNAATPAETWQRYDITFTAARFAAGKKVSPARISVLWNGVLVQDDVVVNGPTREGKAENGASGILTGPILLQDHRSPVRFRNIWLEPL